MRVTIVLAILAFSFAFFTPCNSVLAQEDLTANLTLNDAGAVDIGESSIHPASPLYFLKAIREKIELALAGTKGVKAQRQLEFSQRRLREIKALVVHKRQDLIDSTLERYKAALSETENLVSQDEDLKMQTGEAVARHLDVLQRVYDQVGNPRAKQAIRAAILRAEEHNRLLLQKLDLTLQQKLIKKTAQQQALACRFLEKEASGSGLNDTEKVYLGQKIKDCQKNMQENLKDELMEIKNMRKPQK